MDSRGSLARLFRATSARRDGSGALAMARGGRASLWANAGILAGNAFYFVLSALGLGAILLASHQAFAVLKYRRFDMRIVVIATLLVVPPLVFVASAGRAQGPAVEVYKSSTCTCCTKWVAHLRQHGFSVTATDVADLTEIKMRHKVPDDLSSCHTALVGGYVVEGHVPAADIRRLLKERPPVSGLAAPGMPVGSPGMEGPNPEAYDVLAFVLTVGGRGKVQVFSSHRP